MTSPAQPLYPHTLNPPPFGEDVTMSVNVDALCDAFDRSGSAVMYLNTTLSQADAQALFDSHQLVAELDAVRGVDVIRRATDEETAAANAAKEATPATKTAARSSSSNTSTSST